MPFPYPTYSYSVATVNIPVNILTYLWKYVWYRFQEVKLLRLEDTGIEITNLKS